MKALEGISRVMKLVTMRVLLVVACANWLLEERGVPWHRAVWVVVEFALVVLTAAIIADLVRWCAASKKRQARGEA
ncbi:hypothetical protein DM813_17965 [Pseudomonas alkylphenolica]|uniref:Uncharacterized protein n=1 Tax=Pseudomonas alkylphenolica TaxID=237609 RepID=A0A443ZPT5_9PSED|nr:hypothetical protein [Pseudomonas alkylphenolica]RWU21090.1 hypothetical protein DM813_17965 [Pseudomonas alkylphenolica]